MDETIADFKRLIYLQDYEGVQMRIAAVVKERLQCDSIIALQKEQLLEQQNELSRRDKLFQDLQL